MSTNLHGILSEKYEVDNEIKKEKETLDKRKKTKKKIIKVKNKHYVENASSEDVDKVLKSYCEKCDYKNKVFLGLMSNLA